MQRKKVDIAVWATIAAVAKKVLAILLGDKKGRKFLLYVVGIVLFVIFLPLIVLLGLFGWMAGADGPVIDQNTVLSGLPQEQQSQIALMDETCNTIETVFETEGLYERVRKTHGYISFEDAIAEERTLETDD